MKLNKWSKMSLGWILIFPLSFFVILSGFGCSPAVLPSGEIYINNLKFGVEIAQSTSARSRGLMYRKKLADDRGMLFVFRDEEAHPFWMKNTFVPLDILWLDSNGVIIYIVKNAAPWPRGTPPVINPPVKSRYVLELRGGISSEKGIEEGDKVKFSDEVLEIIGKDSE